MTICINSLLRQSQLTSVEVDPFSYNEHSVEVDPFTRPAAVSMPGKSEVIMDRPSLQHAPTLQVTLTWSHCGTWYTAIIILWNMIYRHHHLMKHDIPPSSPYGTWYTAIIILWNMIYRHHHLMEHTAIITLWNIYRHHHLMEHDILPSSSYGTYRHHHLMEQDILPSSS